MASTPFKQFYEDTMKIEQWDVLDQVKQAVVFLKETKDFFTEDAYFAIQFLSRAHYLDKEAAKEAQKNGIAKQFVRIVQSLEKTITSPDEHIIGVFNLRDFLNVFRNYANICPELGIDFAKYGGVECAISMMKKIINKDVQSNNYTQSIFFDALGCLYNSIRHEKCSVNRYVYRIADAVEVLKTLLDTSEKTLALLTLSFIINEEESEILGRDNETVEYLVELLKEAAVSKDRKALTYGACSYDLTEIADGLKQLSVNDANKKVIFKSDGIQTLNKMLADGFSSEEHTAAAKLLWSLSFDEGIRKSDIVKESVKALTRLTKSTDSHVRSICKGALWQISGGSSSEDKKKSDSEQGGHIMISYNWTHQQLALKIRDELEADGYTVWIDVDKMEASFAYKKQKTIIPLLLEVDYKPEGWLDILIGTKLYYKLCSEDEVKKNMDALKKTISMHCKPHGGVSEIDGGEPVRLRKSETTTSSKTSGALSWSNERVLEWFDDIKLPQLKDVLEFCDGSDLNDIYEKSCRDVAEFEKDCRSSFGLEYKDIIRFKSGLKKIFRN